MAQEGNNVRERDQRQGEKDKQVVENTLAGTGPVIETRPDEARNSHDRSLNEDDVMSAEAEHLKGRIEETRKEMGETIDAIQDRLSFSNMSEQVSEHINNAVETAKGAVYEATIGRAANVMKNITKELSSSSTIKTVKNNPFPLILIGVGAGLLAYQAYSGNEKNGGKRQFTSGSDSRAGTDHTALDSARQTLHGLTDTVSSAAGTAYEKVTGVVDTAYTGAGEAVHAAYNKVGEIGTTAREKYDHHIDENPMAVGAVALALGAAVGMALPATRYESRVLADTRQGLLDKAETSAASLLDKTKEVVREAGRTISEQARSPSEH